MGPLSDLQLDLVELETDDARDVIGNAKLASSFPLASLHSLSTSTCAVPCRARLGASCLMNAPNTSCAVVCRGTLAGARPWSSASPRLAPKLARCSTRSPLVPHSFPTSHLVGHLTGHITGHLTRSPLVPHSFPTSHLTGHLARSPIVPQPFPTPHSFRDALRPVCVSVLVLAF